MKRILLIQEDGEFCRGVQAALASRSFEVRVAADVAEALCLSRTWDPDLILSDLCLARENGYRLLRWLAETPETVTIPTVLMAGPEAVGEMRHAMELGADDVLAKPFDETTLLGAVNGRLKRQASFRHQAEHTQSRLVAILEATPDLVCVLDAAYDRIIYLNRTGRNLLGLTPSSDLNTLRAAAIHPPEVLEQLMRTGVPSAIRDGVWSAETTFRDGTGRTLPFSQVILAQRRDDGRVEYLATVARDVSRERQAQKERSLMEVQLRQAQKLESIGQLAAGIAHEINTPTQYIGDNIRFLQTAFRDLEVLLGRYDEILVQARNGVEGPELDRRLREAKYSADFEYLSLEIPKAIQQSLDGVERVARIVRAMKEFSHPGAHQKTPTDLNHAIENTLTVARNEWKYVAELVTDFDPSLPLVPCLPGEFNQVILNLVINAAHAIADVVGDGANGKGAISVSTRRSDGWVEIQVRDTGAGIPERIRDKIFDPFFTTKPVGKGTGQGLAIARSVVVDKHGGSIQFESECGQGTVFRIRLPLTDSKTQPARNQP